jgi:hypothetical protein
MPSEQRNACELLLQARLQRTSGSRTGRISDAGDGSR